MVTWPLVISWEPQTLHSHRPLLLSPGLGRWKFLWSHLLWAQGGLKKENPLSLTVCWALILALLIPVPIWGLTCWLSFLAHSLQWKIKSKVCKQAPENGSSVDGKAVTEGINDHAGLHIGWNTGRTTIPFSSPSWVQHSQFTQREWAVKSSRDGPFRQRNYSRALPGIHLFILSL